jgi:hypothetical protein
MSDPEIQPAESQPVEPEAQEAAASEPRLTTKEERIAARRAQAGVVPPAEAPAPPADDMPEPGLLD